MDHSHIWEGRLTCFGWDELYGFDVAVCLKFLAPLAMCSEREARNFTKVVYSFLLNACKSVLKVAKTLLKNSLIIAKNVGIVNVYFIFIVITFSGKIGGLTFVPTLAYQMRNK
jgi:hypothetical protein